MPRAGRHHRRAGHRQHFVVLDSGEDKEDSHQYYNGLVDYQNYRREQAEWLKADLERDTCRKAAFKAVFRLNWLSAAVTSYMLAGLLSLVVLRVPVRLVFRVLAETWRQLFLSLVTIGSVLALAFLMNYSGATGTLGLAFAASGVLFPFFSALLGRLGVFLTKSGTSANALFGNLQVVTAGRLGLNPVLMAASNSACGVMGKMISLQSIAVAAAATGMQPSEESWLFRFTLKHSVFLASPIGLIVVFYAYAFLRDRPIPEIQSRLKWLQLQDSDGISGRDSLHVSRYQDRFQAKVGGNAAARDFRMCPQAPV